MNRQPDYIDKNKSLWNKRTDVHVDSDFYNMDEFMKGKSSLNDIELSLLGDISGKTILHLQCHFGQDTLSFARMGAIPTGVDLSDKAIEKAKQLADTLNLKAHFICCNIYDLPQHLNEQFDLVFTSYGTIGWLPDLDQWASIISQFLKPDGRFVFVEFHPVVWMFDNDFERIEYSYFKKEPIVEVETGTYADNKANINLESITWNHSLGEVFQALTSNKMQVLSLKEYDYSPYNCFNKTEEFDNNKFRIKDFGDKIPMVYAIVAKKDNSK